MMPGRVGAVALIAFVPPQPRPRGADGAPLLDLSLLRGPVGLLSLSGILRAISFVTFANAMPLWLVARAGSRPTARCCSRR
jgi:hypothetical protein